MGALSFTFSPVFLFQAQRVKCRCKLPFFRSCLLCHPSTAPQPSCLFPAVLLLQTLRFLLQTQRTAWHAPPTTRVFAAAASGCCCYSTAAGGATTAVQPKQQLEGVGSSCSYPAALAGGEAELPMSNRAVDGVQKEEQVVGA